MFGGGFGSAGAQVVIEEFMEGEEASFFALTDGTAIVPFGSAQDHKRVGDGDVGPNTGGMGAYSPAPVVTADVHQRVMDEVIYPTVRGMAEEGNVYTGFLYAGLMIDKAGKPKVIEFNCRFGDPETQPIMVRLESSLVLLVEAALAKALDKVEATWDPRPTVGVVLAAGGYPGDYAKGDVISGLADAAELARVLQQREYWRELGDLKLLRRYERARAAEVGAMGWGTDGLFGLFSHADTRVQAL
eukprot:gene8066-9954_t